MVAPASEAKGGPTKLTQQARELRALASTLRRSPWRLHRGQPRCSRAGVHIAAVRGCRQSHIAAAAVWFGRP